MIYNGPNLARYDRIEVVQQPFLGYYVDQPRLPESNPATIDILLQDLGIRNDVVIFPHDGYNAEFPAFPRNPKLDIYLLLGYTPGGILVLQQFRSIEDEEDSVFKRVAKVVDDLKNKYEG